VDFDNEMENYFLLESIRIE